MDDQQLGRSANHHSTQLDKTLKTLQDRVKEQEAVLQELRASSVPLETQPSADPETHLQQLKALKVAYESLTPSEPWLPPRESLLPGLLALRVTDEVVKESEDSMVKADFQLQQIRQRLEQERADLEDAKLLQSEMKARVSSLQEKIEERTQQSPGDIAKEMIRTMKKQKVHYDTETVKLMRAYNDFIDKHLAAMLAVEELGGPIVGEMPQVDEDMLGGGFSAQGRLKRGKPSQDQRQRRIDQIWGPRPDLEEEAEEPWDEKRAAAAEMRHLTEKLMNNLIDVDENGPGAYLDLDRESSAARFLVRSKVAQFHPRDATKLRLLDFGGEIDD
ncbi:hypothetical protein BUE80_DR002087 [Diplocarpon rosae]|nr:hypothetical protein BUE80_DR002087 [Diplocarpon rosae]